MKYFTSDLHFNHAKIIDFCPSRVAALGMDKDLYDLYITHQNSFRRAPKCPVTKKFFLYYRGLLIQNHNECLVKVINAVVRKRDILYIVGDFGFGNIKDLKKWLYKLNGRKILVKGNHDRTTRVMLEMGFSDILENDYVVIGNQETKTKVYLSHYPFYPTLWFRFKHWLYWRKNPDKRYLHKRIVDRGQILLHGHTHDSFIQSKFNPRQIHVGIDAWGRPVSEVELIELIKGIK